MEALRDFAGRDMIEQIGILESIRQEGLIEAIPQLIDLYASPSLDAAVGEMLYHTIFSLLRQDRGSLLAGLLHPCPAVRLLCVRVIYSEERPENLSVLLDQLREEKDPAISGEIIRALGRYDHPGVVEAVLPFMRHDDAAVSGWAMEALAGRRDERVRKVLIELVESQVGAAADAGACDFRLAMAVESLAAFPDEEVIDLLARHIHHSNPSLRRLVATALTAMGRQALPGLKRCLEQGSVDERIMAANVIGLIGQRQGADILVESLAESGPLHSNLRFAMYEALGRIPSIRSVIGLTDGLDDREELVLIAVLCGLDNLCNAGVVGAVKEKIAARDDRGQRVLDALLASRAGKLFLELYRDAAVGPMLVDALSKAGDPAAISHYAGLLPASGGVRPGDLERLAEAARKPAPARRLVAADDSSAMLFFYHGAAAELGFELVTAKDGREALEYFKTADQVDLLITDMNMPNLTGIELAVELRKMPQWARLPIVMATTESERSQQEIARQAGIDDFISKPFSRQEFIRKIEEILASR